MHFQSLIFSTMLVLGSLFYSQVGHSQNDELVRVNKIVKGVAIAMASEANSKMPNLLYTTNSRHLGEYVGGDVYLRLQLLRNGSISVKGVSPTVDIIKLKSNIPIRTEHGRLTWKKDIIFDDWKEHKDFYSEFTILTETTIFQAEDGKYIAKSSGKYKWDRKPYITVDLGITKVKIRLEKIAGPEIQKAINKYIRELDKAIEDYIN